MAKIAADMVALVLIEAIKAFRAKGQDGRVITDKDLVLEPFEVTEARVIAGLEAQGIEIVYPSKEEEDGR
jgi:hypothetical protein